MRSGNNLARQTIRTLPAAIAAAVAFGMLAAPFAAAHGAHPDVPAFGANAHGIRDLKAAGARPAYGVIWATESDASKGFPSTIRNLHIARDNGVTPLVQWYYWGDAISVSCIKYGCHGKSRGEWDHYSYKLRDAIKRVMGSRPAIVILETEFNKNGVQTYEPMDGYLSKQSWRFRAKGIQTVLGFGSWGDRYYGKFDQAIRSVHYLGVQELSSAYRDSTWEMQRTADKVYANAKKLHDRFGKRILVTDVGISTWKGKEWVQENEIEQIVWQKRKYADAGITGIAYRWVEDNPRQSWGYHGYAEKYWGLKRSDGSWKPAFRDFVHGTRGTPSAMSAYWG